MTMDELLKILDMEAVSDMEYAESFCNLMEAEVELSEDLFFELIRQLSAGEINVHMREYLNEIISGIADDCIDFFAMVSSYKRSFGGMVNYYIENGQEERIGDEVYAFRKWYTEDNRVLVNDHDKGEEKRVSVCEALVLGRIERLSAGSFDFDFTDAMDLDCGDFEDYVTDDEDEDYENYDYDMSDNENRDRFFEESSGEGYIQ